MGGPEYQLSTKFSPKYQLAKNLAKYQLVKFAIIS